jgi:hypothetical protein
LRKGKYDFVEMRFRVETVKEQRRRLEIMNSQREISLKKDEEESRNNPNSYFNNYINEHTY